MAQAREAMAQGRAMPILWKDFIFDPIQIEAAAASPASAILLIVRMAPDAGRLRSLRRLAESFGMDAVVEVFDEADLRLARESGAELIQVNARDLDNLQVSRGACLDLIRRQPPREAEVWIAASGIEHGSHLNEAAKAGFHAALVGTSLMRGGKPGEALATLLESRDAG